MKKISVVRCYQCGNIAPWPEIYPVYQAVDDVDIYMALCSHNCLQTVQATLNTRFQYMDSARVQKIINLPG